MTYLGPGLRDEAPEVIYSDGAFRAADCNMLAVLKNRASASPRRRCRVCFHQNPDAPLHAMLIVMHQSSYVRPHRHFGKTETLTLIEGSADAILFNQAGAVSDVVPLSSAAEGGSFFYYMPEAVFHTLIFRSPWLVFVENTLGPFDRSSSEGAPWAPPENDPAAGHAYLSQLAIPNAGKGRS